MSETNILSPEKMEAASWKHVLRNEGLLIFRIQ
jgi:hypothetical protein